MHLFPVFEEVIYRFTLESEKEMLNFGDLIQK